MVEGCGKVVCYQNNARIKTVCGDITGAFDVGAEIGTVIHSAATVKHYGSYRYFHEINVEGTKNVIAFARDKDARMIHVSTLSVSGNTYADDFIEKFGSKIIPYKESDLFIGQPLRNVYARSKFAAECEILDAVAGSQRAAIVRIGNLTNRFTDAKFQPNYGENAFLMTRQGACAVKGN